MRTISTAQDAALTSPQRSTRLRVFVDRTGSGDWVDLTTLEGRSWVVGFTREAGIDQQVDTATVLLRRRYEDLSLSPFVDGSKLNASGTLVDIGRPLYVQTCVLPADVEPAETDWVEVFRGAIDEVTWDADPITVTCRDLGGALQDAWIETEAKRPSATTSDAVQDIMQEILDAALGGSAPDLYSITGTSGTPYVTADGPTWEVREYIQSKMPLMQALQVFADQVGWRVAYKWNATDGAFRLTLYDPGRARHAQGILTLTGQPTAAQTHRLNATTYTANTTWLIGATVQATAENIAAAFNAGADAANMEAYARPHPTTNYSRSPSGSWQVVVVWNTAGTAGNAIVWTEALGNATVDGSGTLTGGTDVTSARTFSASDYLDIRRLSVARADIRNVVQVQYGVNESVRTTLTLSDAASITKYGRRWMNISEASTSQIDTAAEADRMGRAILADLKEPTAEVEVELPYFWPAELGDTYTLAANTVHFDTAQVLAVVGIADRFGEDGKARTLLRLRGQPSGGAKRWLKNEGRPGVAAPIDTKTPTTPAITSIAPTVAGLHVEWADPRELTPPVNDFKHTEVHVSTSTGFTPSASTLACATKARRAEVSGLTPGTVYYVKIRHLDTSGNTSAYSAQDSTTTQFSASYHRDPNDERANLVPNGCFSESTLAVSATQPPDRWMTTDRVGAEDLDYWGSGQCYEDLTTYESGLRSIKFTGGGSPGYLQSDPFPVAQATLYKIEARVQASALIVGSEVSLGVISLDKDKAQAYAIALTGYPLAASGTWYTLTFYAYGGFQGASTRYWRILIGPTATSGYDLLVDRVTCTPAKASFHAYRSSAQSIDTGTVTPVVFDTEVDDTGSIYDTATGVVTIVEPGRYHFEASITLDSVPAGSHMRVSFEVNGTETHSGNLIRCTGATDDWRLVAAATFDLQAGDTVEASVWQDSGGALNTVAGQLYCRFSGGRVE